MLKCKSCGEWFYSGEVVGAFNVANVALGDDNRTCPKEHTNKYYGIDYVNESALKS